MFILTFFFFFGGGGGCICKFDLNFMPFVIYFIIIIIFFFLKLGDQITVGSVAFKG